MEEKKQGTAKPPVQVQTPPKSAKGNVPSGTPPNNAQCPNAHAPGGFTWLPCSDCPPVNV